MPVPQQPTIESPAIFIGSSSEGLPVARLFHETLSHELHAALWSQPGIFNPSDFTLESLEQALEKYHYAVIVLSPDDITQSRGKEEVSARDNAVFELGLFVGRHGRRSVFLAVPDSVHVRFPTDIIGLAPVKYKVIHGAQGSETYDVAAACTQILRAVQTRHVQRPAATAHSPFWDSLSDTIVILYGVEAEDNYHPHPRYRISLRDMETAWELKSFLDRRYPNKHIWPVPATHYGWERLVQTGADLVVIGGFVTNAEFAAHRELYEHFFRLKMGRLCIVEGQQIHVPSFAMAAGHSTVEVTDPQGIENYPTELTSRDFGFIFNGTLHMYGRDRRVVAIAGVKGHGTRGAAHYLIGDRPLIDNHLTSLSREDTLELVVEADVESDVVDRVKALSIRLNGQEIVKQASRHSMPCDLGRSCDGCDFGIENVRAHRHPVSSRMLTSQIKAIVLDLDDTLVDTFGALIVPLEIKAAKAMIEAGARDRDSAALASTLLRLRRVAPAELENELKRTGFTQKAIAARSRLLTKVSIDHLVLSPEVRQLLNQLQTHFELVLLTGGAPRFQYSKIDKLEIRPHFTDIVVTQSSTTAKVDAIREFAARRGFRNENVLVVGNRLDNEIAAGNALGMPTVWIRCGEGSELKPGKSTGQPDFVLRQVLDLPSILWSP